MARLSKKKKKTRSLTPIVLGVDMRVQFDQRTLIDECMLCTCLANLVLEGR